MIAPQRFLFNRDFDPDLLDGGRNRSGGKAGGGKPPSMFTEDDLARVRAEGVAEGRERAFREAARSLELRLTEAFETIGERLEESMSGRDTANAAIAREANAIAVAIARRMVPELYRRNAAAEIEHAVATVLSQVLETAELTVRTAEALADPVRERVETLAETRGIGGRVRITADPSLTEGDYRIEWLGGGAERNAAAMWNDIEAIVEKNLGFVPAKLNQENTTPMLECLASAPTEGTEVGENHG
jgi:flagellar assembly protein FliH